MDLLGGDEHAVDPLEGGGKVGKGGAQLAQHRLDLGQLSLGVNLAAPHPVLPILDLPIKVEKYISKFNNNMECTPKT